MAGTIVADDIQHSTAGSVGTEYVVQGSAKCFITFDQSTNTLNKSLNVSSVSDDAVGVFTVAFSNNFDDYQYCNYGAADGGGTTFAVVTNAHNASYASGSYRSTSTNRSGTRNINDNALNERTFTALAYLGDLA